MIDKFQLLCNKRSKIHSRIKKVLEERLSIAERGKSNLSVVDQVWKLYGKLEYLYEKDRVLFHKQQKLKTHSLE